MERLDTLYNEVSRVRFRLAAAREAFAGCDDRRKAETLGRVVGSIVCHFRHQDGRGRRPSSVLERVTAVPRSGGEPACYPADLFADRVGYPPPHKKQGHLP